MSFASNMYSVRTLIVLQHLSKGFFLTFIQYLLNTYTNCIFRLKKITDGDVNKRFLSK